MKAATRLLAAFALLAACIGLSACSDLGAGGLDGPTETAMAAPGKPSGNLVISNWPAYIDPGPNGSVAEFEDRTGASVKYIEDINSNLEFFGKLRPELEAGGAGGRDIIVVTDWMAKKMYDLGYIQELNPDTIQTALDNLAPQFESEGAYDPDHKFSIPWQGGMTGIWVNTATDANEITSVNQLFDPKYKGRALPGFRMLAVYFDGPEDVYQIKLTGPAKAVAKHKKAFEEWLAAFK